MKVLVVGGGGREHAIVRRLKESQHVTQLFCAPGNGGIAQDAQCVPIAATEIQALTAWAVQQQIDYVVVAPDDPLALGLVDALAQEGIAAFGPSKAAARIEASKAFSKNLMKQHGIPTAAYEIFDNADRAQEFLMQRTEYPVVIKADGLALGKGVLICQTQQQALDAVDSMMRHGAFGSAGSRIVIEDFLTGPEVSVLCLTDGTTIVPLVSSMDHKRVGDGDTGLNTGGMGVIAPNPYYTPVVAQQCMQEIFQPTIHAMRAQGCPFQGCLYFGLMLTPQGPRVIEYNCRFGDPEAQAVLMLLENDLLELMQATTNGTLAECCVRFREGAAACVVLASAGYPQSYQTGKPIAGLVNGQPCDSRVQAFHAGTRCDAGQLLTAGGRVLGLTAAASTLHDALALVYDAAKEIHFEGMYVRRDIGARALAAEQQQEE